MIKAKILIYIIFYDFQKAQDPAPYDKDKEENFRGLLRDIFQKTPIYIHDYVSEHFPKIIQEWYAKELPQERRVDTIYTDSSNKQYKMALKKKVDEDYRRFLGNHRFSFNPTQNLIEVRECSVIKRIH